MDEPVATPDSLLPYARWTEEALRAVAADALEHVAAHGLPGDHHFYVSFRTGHPGVVLPASLKARYPEEMTIVLQHRFWDLKVERDVPRFTVGLSFGGVATTLVVPFAAMTAFADPPAKFGLRFEGTAAAVATPEPDPEQPDLPPVDPATQVVSLDAFRRRPTKS